MRQTNIGIAFATLIGTLVLMTSVPASGDKKNSVADVGARLFDHSRHPSGPTLNCARCHMADTQGAWKNIGKREHARCFDCHKFSASCSVLKRKEGKVCLSCHTTFQARCTPPGYIRPTVGGSAFYAKYSHRTHAQTRASTGAQCESCHGTFGVAAPGKGTLSAGHSNCGGCHGKGVEPLIATSCEGCHIRGTLVPTTGKQSLYSVAGAFDHQAHAGLQRVGTQGRDCLVCHSNIKESVSDSVIPKPTMAGCMSSCHDGEKAFNAIGTTCTRCHVKGTGH